MGARTFFALCARSAQEKKNGGARRKTTAKKAKAPSVKEKVRIRAFSALRRTTPEIRLQSP
jgi:hypothetical protein